MKKQLMAGLLSASMLLSITACAGNGANITSANNISSEINVNENDLALVELSDTDKENIGKALADFSLNLMKENLKAKDKGVNVLVSPESVLYALSMTGNGADNTTLTQFESVLAGGESMGMVNSYLAKNMDETGNQLSLANSIWIRDNANRIQVNDDFLALNKYVYDADAFKSAFDDTTLKDINGWVNEKTKGMIPSVLEYIDADAVMYLVNAAAFDAKWFEKYEDDDVKENEIFYNYLGDEETVTMLMSTENQFIITEDATGFIKPYEGGGYAFVGILPNEGVDLNDYIESLTGEAWLDMYYNAEDSSVAVWMPEFSDDYDIELSDALINMGLEDAFHEGADFGKMAQTSSGSLYINRVIHKTHIDVDRNGTKAAAATVVEMTENCAIGEPIYDFVVLDRPFLYAIVDTNTGLPVFMGTVNSCQ